MSSQHESIISLENVSFTYTGEAVLKDIFVDIPKGDFVGLIGPNGSGKSTLIKVMLGLLKPTSGTVELFKTPISEFHQWNKIGYIPQRPGSNTIPFPLTALEVVLMQAESKHQALSALAEVGVEHLAARPIMHMSGGQLQRVFIARALSHSPELLVMDEPTSGVDEESQAEFYALLKRLHNKGITIILVSHDIDAVAHEVNHLLCLNKSIVCHGKPSEVLKNDFWQKLYGKDLKMILHGH